MGKLSPGQFLRTGAIVTLLAFVTAAVLAPPDPFSRIIITVVLMVFALPIAYYLRSRGAFGSIFD